MAILDKKYCYRGQYDQCHFENERHSRLYFSTEQHLPLLHNLWLLMINTIEPVRPDRSYPPHKEGQTQKIPNLLHSLPAN